MDLGDVFPRERVEWRGKEYFLTPPSFETERLFKEYLERESLLALRRKRDLYDSEADYREAERALTRDWSAKVYAYGMPECVRCLQSAENFRHLLWLVLTQRQPGDRPPLSPYLGREDVEKMWADLAYPGQGGGTGNALLDAWDRLHDPNARPAAGAPAPPPTDSTPTKSAPSS